MNIHWKNEQLTITGASGYFSPRGIFESGQCFRFTCDDGGVWSGVAGTRRIYVTSNGSDIIIHPVPTQEYSLYLQKYFDLDRDYPGIADKLCARDSIMRKATSGRLGIRILRQDPFETLISFIISQNNNIPRITKIVNSLCALYGETRTDEGGDYHLFPTPKAMLDGGIEGLDTIKAGFRAKYIYAAAKAVSEGPLDLAALEQSGTGELIGELCKVYGVGVKIASCVALFAYGRFDSFPIDVWIKRVMADYYGSKSHEELFGEYAGIAQQYLFCYIREINKGANNPNG